MSNWLIIITGAAIVAILAALGVYAWLQDDRTLGQRVSKALQWWGQTDKKLEQLKASTLLWIIREADDLLQYPDELFEETHQRLLNLKTRIKKIQIVRKKQGLFR